MVVMSAKGHNKRGIKPAPVTCNLGDGGLTVPLLVSTGSPRGHTQKFLAQVRTERVKKEALDHYENTPIQMY